MTPPSPSSSPIRSLRRALHFALGAAGVYAVLLGPVGALGQDPTPSPSATASSTPTTTATPTTEPTQAPTQAPTQTPTQAPTQAPTQTPTQTPESTTTPESTSTPGSTSTPAGTPESTPTSTPTSEPTPETTTEEGGELTEEFVSGGFDENDPRKGSSRKRDKGQPEVEGEPEVKPRRKPIRNSDGTPTLDNPTYTLATPGAAPIGVPNFIIEKFRIPPFLLPIYQAAGMQYGVRWELLAAINEIETDYGRNLNVSYAGALGWMQFMPATWKAYGVDANRDGIKDPYNPVDAIFAAARYLKAAGYEQDVRKAVFAYNHADWYVDSVLMRARLIGGLPSNFVGSLTGLTQARFPVHAKASYAGDLDEKDAKKRAPKGGNAARLVESDAGRRGIKIFAKAGAPAIAVNDGRIVKVGQTKRLGRFVQLQDVYGNTFTYAHLKKVAATYPAPRERHVTEREIARELDLPRKDAKPKAAASSTSRKRSAARTSRRMPARKSKRESVHEPVAEAPVVEKERLFANPQRPGARAAGGEVQLAEASYRPVAGAPLRLTRRDYEAKPLRKGARVIAGTILGRIGRVSEKAAPHLLFEIRPAGRGAPRIDPKPILDGWKLLESTEIYRAAGRNPFFGPDAKTLSIGQILLMSKEALVKRVLANPRVDIYACGRQDVRVGAIDRRVLASLEFLAASGLRPTVSSLRCGRSSLYTASGNLSAHPSGNAVDIAAINGISILGNQGKGSITDITVQRLLTLQGTMKPNQIITLMKYEGADNTFALGDHHDHIHVGWQPLYGTNSKAAKQVNAVLKPKQWIKLIDRLKDIDNPEIRKGPKKHVLRVDRDERRAEASRRHVASDAHVGE